jgi:hypothetical protein
LTWNSAELQRIYDIELNVSINWVWNGGIDVRLGDTSHGFLAEENVSSADDIVPWLQEAIAHFYPDSTYAKSLNADVHERAQNRVFRVFTPLQAVAQVRCPNCGAPHTGPPPGTTEVFGFVCAQCGLPVEVKLPRVQ